MSTYAGSIHALTHVRVWQVFELRGAGGEQPAGAPELAQTVRHESPSGAVSGRQNAPHVHCAAPSPDGRLLAAADLGCDAVFLYALAPSGPVPRTRRAATPPCGPWRNPLEGRRSRPPAHSRCPALSLLARVSTAAGRGPRHVAWHPSGECLLLVGELDNSLSAWRLRRDGAGSACGLTQTCAVSTVPAGWSGESYAGALRLSPDGRFAYCSNRLHDSVAVFAVHGGEEPRVEPVQTVGSGVRFPRDLWVGADFLLVGGQKGGGVHRWERDPASGRLVGPGRPLAPAIPCPVGFACV